jgi:hypothetical protein
MKLSVIHRMIAPMGPPIDMDLKRHGQELAGLIALEVAWQRLSGQFVAHRLCNTFPGKIERQFLVFHPACTFLYTDNPANSEKHVRYIQKACFHNLREVVVMGLLQRFFLDRIECIFNHLRSQRATSLPERASIEESIERLASVPLYNPDWVRLRLDGGHRMVFDKIHATLGIGKRAQQVINSRGALEGILYPGGVKVVSIAEQKYATQALGQLDEIARISGQIADRAPFGFGDQTVLAKVLNTSAGKVRDDLKATLDGYADMSPLAPENMRLQYLSHINHLVLTDYRQEILPEFEKLVTSLAKESDKLKAAAEDSRRKGTPVPPPEKIEASLKEVSRDVAGLRGADTAAGGDTGFDTFVERASPYVSGLLKVGRAILTILGVVL